MAPHYRHIACQGIPSQPTTVVATSYSSDSQLQTSIISGNDKHCPLDPDLPDEGIYIIHGNRALQIAAPPCEKRRCSNSHLCRCDISCLSTECSPVGHQNLKQRALGWPIWKPCPGCLFNWLRLYQAAEAVHKLGMQFLQHPRTFTWADRYDKQGFHRDVDLDEQPVRSNSNGKHPESADPFGNYCPPRVFEWMKESWDDFIDSGCCKPGSITALPDDEDDGDDEDDEDDRADKRCTSSESDVSKDSDTDSDWDDVDIPFKPASTSSHTESEEYDLIDDLIKEEFPKLQRSSNASPQPKPEQQHPTVHYESPDEDEPPPPIIIPPKNMTIGKGLPHLREPEVLRPTRSRADNSPTVTDLKDIGTRLTMGVKRLYHDLVTSDPEDKGRTKHRKTDATVLQPGSWCSPGGTVHWSPKEHRRTPRKLILT
ncbi:hypothetical protein F5Y04DRAFT_41552 [Hypomontagnella monticulosa]|nr:hypothetical protein F5Y04DRAFT_41552 [Hypomontagnella monticulosa]